MEPLHAIASKRTAMLPPLLLAAILLGCVAGSIHEEVLEGISTP